MIKEINQIGFSVLTFDLRGHGTSGDAPLGLGIKEKNDIKPLIKKISKVLGDQVKEVKISSRLKDSPSCIVAASNDPTAKKQELMKAMGQTGNQDIKPILEINPSHAIIKKMKGMRKGKGFDSISQLLFDQAILLEGAKLKNPTDLVNRLNTLLTNSL